MGSRSEEIWSHLVEVIPGGVNSPVRSLAAMGRKPIIADHASGPYLYDVDGVEYIDYCLSWGPLILGHCHPVIVEAVKKRLEKGSSFGMTTEIEYLLAKKVVELIPTVEKIRFVSSGTEATMSALRLARGYTGKNTIIKFEGNYHGHADQLLVQAGSGVTGLNQTSSSLGIPVDMVRHTVVLPYNDSVAFKKFLSQSDRVEDIAAIILEPIAGNMGVVPATQEFIDVLREESKKIGALLIFDEVMTGFRVALQGALSIYKVVPDLICYGKIVGGGYPAAAFGGKREIMDRLAPIGGVYQAGTLSGNPVAMEAGLQTLQRVSQPNFYQTLEKKTALLLDPLRKLIQEKNYNLCIQSVGSMFTLFFGARSVVTNKDVAKLSEERYATFFRYLTAHGIYPPPSQYEAWFLSSTHTDELLIKTRQIIEKYLTTIYKD